MPKWFKFTTGIVDFDIAGFQEEWKRNEPGGNPYACSYNLSKNAITQEGNNIIATKLINYIETLTNKC